MPTGRPPKDETPEQSKGRSEFYGFVPIKRVSKEEVMKMYPKVEDGFEQWVKNNPDWIY